MRTTLPATIAILFILLQNSIQGSECRKNLTNGDIQKAYDIVLKIIKASEDAETEKKKALDVETGMGHYYEMRINYNERTKNAYRSGLINLELIKYFKHRYGLTLESISVDEKNRIREEGLRRKICPKQPICQNSKYRTADGSCNNLQHPTWGKSYTVYGRLLPAEYEDGVGASKSKSVNGEPLPNARLISTTVALDVDIPSKKYTHLMPLFGQFFAHDITSVALPDPLFRCCNKNLSLDAPYCANTEVPKNDYFYPKFGVQCLQFPRGLPASNDCELGIRDPFNRVTSFIDASIVYGSSYETARSLRTFEKGTLRTSLLNPEVPPPIELDVCNIKKYQPPCILAGDDRVNMHTMLSEQHQLWFREHNRIATILAEMNKHWDDETIYQETRRILIAMLQHIIFNELIPIFMGKRGIKKYGLSLLPEGFSDNYDSSLDPRLLTEFVGASFRIGHSLIQGKNEKRTEDRIRDGSYKLAKSYNWPIPLYYEKDYEELLRGATTMPCQSLDTFFTHGLSNHFFQGLNISFGGDLVAINIERGRDFALPSYTKLREYCKLKPIKSFDDLEGVMRKQALNAFRQVYSNVHDIEPYLGSLAELPEKGEFVSPVVQCIIGRQFHRLMRADRFWYENGNMDTSFTESQLNEIRKSSMARLLCDNTKITMMQLKSLHLISETNPLLPCAGDLIPRMNLNLWKEDEGPGIFQIPYTFLQKIIPQILQYFCG